MRRRWSKQDIAILIDQWNKHVKAQDIANQLGRSLASVHIKLSSIRQEGRIGYLYDPVCTVPGCNEPHASKGKCATHYRKYLRHMQNHQQSA